MTVGKWAKVETLDPQNSAAFDLPGTILVAFDSARQELQNELSHGPDTAAQGHNVKVKSQEDILAKDAFLYRSYIALSKYSIPLSEIDSSLPPTSNPLVAIRRFADYMVNSEKRKRIVEQITAELEKGQQCDDICALMNSFIFVHEENIDDSLRVLSKTSSLECHAATVQCLLKLNRYDLAERAEKMQKKDENSTVTQLTATWISLALNTCLKEAFCICQEMIDKYGATPSLLISQAACLIQQQKYEDAEQLLQDAQQRDRDNPEVLVGLVVVSEFLGKPFEVTNRYINQLKQDYPHHVWTKDYLAKEAEFDCVAQESSA
ncbi:coatomer epsilon subunit domain-containing protein [Ditylenchus destructor]|uniref:Coatomer subunit epsilon n=1 Tax=Ditylenchus destructor TaxID=166010 RepID=A0AAD4R5T9_9BILA|nr:coatomer epsilon subunit domain-containing protein [Ditylenchus destructor]